MKYPKPLEKLIESFQLYPGIGPKTAERLAFFTFLNLKDEDVINFSNNLLRIKTELKYCSVCGVITDSKKCQICSDFNRERKLLVVEGTKDVNVFEKTGQYFGRYHILNGLISPLNGVGPDDVNIQGLLKRIEDEKIEEIIIATSATIEGEMTALYIKNLFENREIKVYRIGYGLPAGGDIEYADEITLIKALEGRKEM
ncbi:MAG TPA: recombination protein RecR [Acholeplasmataceae bacterium]|nr:recombination protein RecR [Acholeplasmataceae bacterium]